MLRRQEDMETAKKRAYLEKIERRIDEVSDLLAQLFEYVRVEVDEIAFEEEKINLGNFFAETLSLFYEDFMEKGCEPEVAIDKEPCYCPKRRIR